MFWKTVAALNYLSITVFADDKLIFIQSFFLFLFFHFALLQRRLWLLFVRGLMSVSLSCCSSLRGRGIISHPITVSLTRTVKHFSSTRISLHLTDILQLTDHSAGKRADLWVSPVKLKFSVLGVNALPSEDVALNVVEFRIFLLLTPMTWLKI